MSAEREMTEKRTNLENWMEARRVLWRKCSKWPKHGPPGKTLHATPSPPLFLKIHSTTRGPHGRHARGPKLGSSTPRCMFSVEKTISPIFGLFVQNLHVSAVSPSQTNKNYIGLTPRTSEQEWDFMRVYYRVIKGAIHTQKNNIPNSSRAVRSYVRRRISP